MKFEDIRIPGNIVIVNGEKDDHDIFALTLSTCQWCKKGKQWLIEKGYTHKFLDVDLLPYDDKQELKRSIRNLFETMIRYPFLIIDGKEFFAGYNPEKWEEMLK